MLLTKSKYLIGLECPRYLWLVFNKPDSIPPFSPEAQSRMQQGIEVGERAKALFPNGVDIQGDFKENIRKTAELVKQNRILFEAGFVVGDLYARADVLVPFEEGFELIEVKGTNSVKPEHLDDLSFQLFVYLKSGVKITKCSVLHLNKEFVRHGDVNVHELFVREDVTRGVFKAMENIEQRINKMLEIVRLPTPPKFEYAEHAVNSEKCGAAECHAFLPDGNVFELIHGGKKSVELASVEILHLRDIPDEFKLTTNQGIQRECARSGKPFIDKEKIGKFLGALKRPLSFLDFESFTTAIPLFDNLGPWQHVPFQYSLHVYDEHFEFLYEGKGDPREEFVQRLLKDLPSTGSIVVYSQSFEIGRLKELAQLFPDKRDAIESVIARIVDLIVPFRSFHYYDPQQKGSCSIKAVLPALTGVSYKELGISSGTVASNAYYEFFTSGKGDWQKIKKDLLEYCKLDTLAMVKIVEKLAQV